MSEDEVRFPETEAEADIHELFAGNYQKPSRYEHVIESSGDHVFNRVVLGEREEVARLSADEIDNYPVLKRMPPVRYL